MGEGKPSRRVTVSSEGTKRFGPIGEDKSWEILKLRVHPGNETGLHDIHSISAEQRAISSRVPGPTRGQMKPRSSQKKAGGFLSRLFRS